MTIEIRRERKAARRFLWVIDVLIAMFIVVSGGFAVISPPTSFLHYIHPHWLVILWGLMLLLGGILLLLGRVIGLWILETTGLALSIPGTVIYLVCIAWFLPEDVSLITAAALFAVAALSQFRRYVDVRMFIFEPGDKPVIGVSRILSRWSRNGESQ